MYKMVPLGNEKHEASEEHDKIDDDECNESKRVNLEASMQAAGRPLYILDDYIFNLWVFNAEYPVKEKYTNLTYNQPPLTINGFRKF